MDYNNLYSVLFLFVGICIVVGFCIWLLNCYSFSKLLQKAGEDGWKAFIPIYGKYVECEKFWDVKGFYLYLAAILMPFVVGIFVATFPFLGFLNGVSSVLTTIVTILFSISVGKAFNKSTPFIIGLVFFPFIFLLILALDKNTKYKNGNQPTNDTNLNEEHHYFEYNNNVQKDMYNNYYQQQNQQQNQQHYQYQQKNNNNQFFEQEQRMMQFQQEQQNQATINQMNMQQMQQQNNNNLF